MPKLRVLIVDDAVVVRKILSDALAADPEIEVAGFAANGRIALQKIPQVNPDIVTLDVEMPEMDGLATLKAIREQYPKLPVVMFSTLTEQGARTTLEALSMGASDYVTKPANVGSVSVAKERVRQELVQKIRSLCGRGTVDGSVNTPSATGVRGDVSRKSLSSAPNAQVDILAIGVSTGGPNALGDLIPLVPETFPVPVVIVQHMPALFTRLLAERLTAKSKVRAFEAEEGMLVKPGTVYIAPGDYHMTLKRDGGDVKIALNQGTPENSCRPAVDVLFRSVASEYGSRVLAVVLTGMGHDGLRGCEIIREKGGQVIVQDEATSVVWGMPGSVVHAGLAESVLPLPKIMPEILTRVSRFRERAGAVRIPAGGV